MSENDELIIHDGRQSETAAAVQRGVSRLLRHCGHACLTEFPLVSGRRADILSIDDKGLIWIIEIKSSLADFRADHKWQEYNDYCDQLFFAHPMDMDPQVFPDETGLIIADAFGAEITRPAPLAKLASARRKALTLRIARTASLRLQKVFDPGLG
jgi:hypothetical protein